MRKLLIIIAITLCIFQMVVLATVINIGSDVIDRESAWAVAGTTFIVKNNPANGTGKITSVKIWANTNLTNVSVATFFVVSGNNLSTRDYEFIGNVTAGDVRTFTVDLDVVADDYLGAYAVSGQMERTSSGAGIWYIAANKIPCTNQAFSPVDSDVSLGGTGATEEEEEANAIFFGTNF